MLAEFSELFRGSRLAHGTWDKSTGNMATVLSPPTQDDYKKHLDGVLGLGIVPVTEDGTCYFGAIDVDIETINHKDLYARITSRNLPLSVCRSKSGGAHLYVFFKDPYPSSQVQTILRKWAGVLGFPQKTEIFPKQTKSTNANVGNWINLCYFNAKNTVRYSIRDNGSITLEEFLNNIVFYNGKDDIDEQLTEDLIQIDLMPPCLKTITENGLPSGNRNVGLFSYGVFYRKSSPNGWADKLRYHNQNYVSPPLPSRELEALIKSIGDRQYQYKCNEEPLCSNCDRKTCLTLPYGVGNKPWEDENNFDEVAYGNLRKIVTDPPSYILEVNGRDLYLTSDQFRKFDNLRKRIFEQHDAVLRPMKQLQWEQKMRELLTMKKDIEAPDDASEIGAINEKIDDYLALSDRTRSREDLLRGQPWLDKEKGKVFFQVNYLQKFLNSKNVFIDNKDLFAILHRRKSSHELIRIKGKVIRAWFMTNNDVNRQTEDYTDQIFEREDDI